MEETRREPAKLWVVKFEVIDASRGEVGKEMRKTAQAIKAQLQESWNENGVAKKDLLAFVDKVNEFKGSV